MTTMIGPNEHQLWRLAEGQWSVAQVKQMSDGLRDLVKTLGDLVNMDSFQGQTATAAKDATKAIADSLTATADWADRINAKVEEANGHRATAQTHLDNLSAGFDQSWLGQAKQVALVGAVAVANGVSLEQAGQAVVAGHRTRPRRPRSPPSGPT